MSENHPVALDEPVAVSSALETGRQKLPMVGLGGSAGSIQPLLTFFEAMPADSGIAFVVILHLSPDHESTLPALIQRVTSMATIQVVDTVEVLPNHVYVIPPGKALAAADGQLRVTDLQAERGKRVAVDLFFRTLADTHGPNSAAIVLSGADHDGTLGIKRIKEMGGLTIAQEPEEAEHTSMPRSAIQTGMIDWVLPISEIPARLLRYYRIAQKIVLPSEDGPLSEEPAPPAPDRSESVLREVLGVLRSCTGRDFSYYKRATILRRISRRMQVNGIEDLTGYLAHLRTHPGEAGALLQDLLISVTNFFRDRDAFEALSLHIPELFQGKSTGDCVRAWVPACATGEEAYSIAILLAEHARTLEAPPAIQVFATDLDEEAIATARTGTYPFTISVDVGEERLRRFFVMDNRGYRIRQELRETVLFAAHDLLRDSPFSRMDIVSCRNLLIYLNREAQSRVLDIFAFALWPEGRLFLGSSESIDDGSPLFVPVDKKNRIYLHRSVSRPVFPIPTSHGTVARALKAQEQLRERAGASKESSAAAGRHLLPGLLPRPSTESDRTFWNELHLKLIERLAPPSLVVNKDYDILHLSESAGRYLQFTAGELKRNLLALVNPMLRVELRAALFQASNSQTPVEICGAPVDIEGKRHVINMHVRPAADLAAGLLLVSFESAEGHAHDPEIALILKPEAEAITRHLEREMELMKSELRETIEQHEASTEELKASNEELQAMNEELRCATEELETSREELQSINEELTTVNQELKCKLDELSHANSDLNNLMVSTAIPTIFLDSDLRIMRYTPSAVAIFNLIPTDIGRPLSDLKHRLDYPQLEQEARSVFQNLAGFERRVNEVGEARCFLARLLPYRTAEDEVAGVVLTLVDITESRRSAAALEQSESRFRKLVAQAKAGITETDLDQRFTYVNDQFCEMAGRSREELLKMTVTDITEPEDLTCDLPRFDQMLVTGEPFAVEQRLIRPDGSRLWIFRNVAPIYEGEKIIGVSTVAIDINAAKMVEFDRNRAIQQLEQSREELWKAFSENERVREQLKAASEAKDHFLAVLSHELRTPLTPVLMATRILGRRQDLPEDLRDTIEMIQRNVRIEAQFIDDLLDVTRIEHGKLEIAKEPVNLHQVIHHAINVAESEIIERKQQLDVELNAPEFQVLGDDTRLQQVLWNLVKNASKFSPENSRIRVASWNEPDRILVSVADNGVGIEPAAMSLIFDPFRQENVDVARQFGGLGLGLAIARASVEAHGGALRAESHGRGAGATFTVDLPLHIPAAS